MKDVCAKEEIRIRASIAVQPTSTDVRLASLERSPMVTFNIKDSKNVAAAGNDIIISSKTYPQHQQLPSTAQNSIEFQSFISSSTEQVELSKVLSELLKQSFPLAYPCFIAKNDLRLGESWLDQTSKALNSAKFFFLILCGQDLYKHWLHFEAGAAWQKSDVIKIVLTHSGLTPDKLPQPYSSWQGAQLDTFDGLQTLIKSLASHLNQQNSESVNTEEILQKILTAKAKTRY